jgi:hypothetical protein
MRSVSVAALLTAVAAAAGLIVYTDRSGTPRQASNAILVGACAHAKPPSWFDETSNWGSAAGKIGPGVVVTLCGTIGTPLTVQGSGAAGRPITLRFASGASLSEPVCPGSGCLAVNGFSHIVVDGAGSGVIQNTANGTGLQNQTDQTLGIYMQGCDYCAIENLTVRDIYVRTSPTDYQAGGNGIELYDGNHDSIDNVTVHDADWALYQRYDRSGQGREVSIHDNDFYNSDHDIALTFNFPGGSTGPFFYYRNYLHDFANWDSPDDVYHHDGIHCFTSTTGGVPAHVDGLYWYDNLTEGSFGNNMTSPVFLEGGTGSGATPCADASSDIYLFDNVTIGDVGLANGQMQLGSGADFAYNNTLVGNGTGVGVTVSSGVTFENNVVSGFNQLIVSQSGNGFAPGSPNHNVYAAGGNNAFVCNGDYLNFSQFDAWKACAGGARDVQSVRARSALLGPDGEPTAASPMRSAGANLSASCTGLLAPLCTDFIGNPRPATGPWEAGAYNWSAGNARRPG